jgi:hypothetical protein
MKSSPQSERWTAIVSFGSTVPIKDASKLSRRSSVSVRHAPSQNVQSRAQGWPFMMPLWLISSSAEEHFLDLEDEEPPRFEFVSRGALGSIGIAFSEANMTPAAMTSATFGSLIPCHPVFRIIADPAITPNYLQKGHIECVSLRLRQALGLIEAVIRYRDVNLDQSPPAVRAQEYQAFQAVHFADLIDWNGTPGQIVGYLRPGGSIADNGT